MTGLPTGTVTFLFTDVVGSTRMWESEPAAMAGAMIRHDELIEQCVEKAGGQLVRPRGEGDSRFAVFTRSVDAVNAAVAIGRGLQAEPMTTSVPIRVRTAIHSGEADLRAGDYYGDCVNRCARIRGIGHPEQILLSGTAHGLLSQLAEQVGVLDLGEHRMKDLTAAERIFQVTHPDLPAEFPALLSLDRARHNLPIQLSSFVGREEELAEVTKMVTASRLVSLLGPGGTGKTRLAYQVAPEVVGDFSGGVWVAELATVVEEGGLPLAVLASLGLREEPGVEAIETVVEHLRDRQILVILDNCEHLIAAAAEIAQTLLERCPTVRLLATSREALRIPGEVVYQVPGLCLPSADVPDYLEALADTDAVRLFVTRAADVRPGFALSVENAPDVTAICIHLDGLPLGIELAASRVRSLSPVQINARLGAALDLLSKGARGATTRQATLRGAIDWSQRLLDEPERVLFRRLAVFVGGWQLEAAEKVCSGDGLDVSDVLNTLDSLVDKSLVAVGEDDKGQTRYRLLETIRAYAAERLTEAGEADLVAEQHSAWCASLARATWDAPPGSDAQSEWYARLGAEHPNLLAALGHLCGRGDPRALAIAVQLSGFWLLLGHEGIAQSQFLAALAVPSGPSLSRANVLGALGQIATNRGDYQAARTRFQQALTMACELGDRWNQGWWVGKLGGVANDLADYPEARARLEEALAIVRELGDRRSEGNLIGDLGVVASRIDDYPEARARFSEALAIARELGDRNSESLWLGNLGNISISQGDYHDARARVEEALVLARDLGDRRREGILVGRLGNVALSLGDYPEARGRTEEARNIARDVGDRHFEGIWIGQLGEVAAHLGDYPEARVRNEEALDIARDLGDRHSEGILLGQLGDVARSRGDYPEARACYQEALAIARDIGNSHSEEILVGQLADLVTHLAD